MEVIKITEKPSIYLLVDTDLEDTVNPILEVQADTEGVFHQIALYSEYELNQATEVHKLITFYSPRDLTKKVEWLEELDDAAFATADHNPYEEKYENLPLKETFEQATNKPVFGPEPPPKYCVPEGYYTRAEDEYNDLEFEEEILREFEKEERERESRRSKKQT